MMRHSKASMTTDVYMQSLEPELRLAINSTYDGLMGDGTKGNSYSPGFAGDGSGVRDLSTPARQ